MNFGVTGLPATRARHPEASTLPAVLPGGDLGPSAEEQEAAYEKWRKALRLATVHGPVIGRSLLHPASEGVEAAFGTAVSLL